MAKLRVREQGRLERLRRIKESARGIFAREGFTGATMRRIAEEAGVSSGLVFLHARDKGELLLMVLNDDLDRLTRQAFRGIDEGAPLLAQLEAVFRKRYAYWARDPALSLHALEQSHYVRTGGVTAQALSESARYVRQRDAFGAGVTQLIAAKQRAGELDASIAPETIARLIMDVYFTEIRRWLRGAHGADVERGVRDLVELLGLALRGMLAERRQRISGGTC